MGHSRDGEFRLLRGRDMKSSEDGQLRRLEVYEMEK